MDRCSLTLLLTLVSSGCSSPPADPRGAFDAALATDLAVAPSVDAAAADLYRSATSGSDAAVDGNPAANSYGQDGPHSVSTSTLTVTPPGGSSFTVVAYLPSGTMAGPVVVISSGLQQTGVAYAPYARRLASWGIVALTRDDPGPLTQTPSVVSDLSYEVGVWLAAQNADSTSALSARLDLAKVGLAGHSRGGQVSLLAAEGDLKGKIRGVFGLDPVDSAMSGNPQARTHLATIGVPLAFLGETTDGMGANACAPSADNFLALYALASSPAVAITALGADHTQFEDPANCSFCFFCGAGTAPAATVLAYSVEYLTAFFARELLDDQSVGAALGTSADVAAGLITVSSK